MPTVLLIRGWRIFFYSNEGDEPIHVHCQKADAECKYWLDRENFEIVEAFGHNVKPADRREIKRLIFEYFEDIERAWDQFKRKRK
jgi:hypothetical protein